MDGALKYKEEKCKNCKNKSNKNDLCEIRQSRFSKEWNCSNFEDKNIKK